MPPKAAKPAAEPGFFSRQWKKYFGDPATRDVRFKLLRNSILFGVAVLTFSVITRDADPSAEQQVAHIETTEEFSPL